LAAEPAIPSRNEEAQPMMFRRLLGGSRRRKETARKRSALGQRRLSSHSLQSLEPRLPLANDFFVVPGSSADSVTVSFEWVSRSARYNNEIGVYAVSDDAGTVNGLKPGDSGYARAVQQGGSVLFKSGTGAGQQTSLNFSGGQRLGFFIVQNGSLSAWRGNGDNRIGRGTIAFFSFDQANPDKFDHVRSTALSSTSKQFAFEDLLQGGDRDFNDAVIRVSRTNSSSAIPAPTISLAPESDTGTVGDQGTNLASVNLSGTTIPGGRAELVGRNQSQTANAQGAFTFTGVSLNQGINNLTLRISDSAGNTRDQAFSINRQTSTLSASFGLNTASDTGNAGDQRTTMATVGLTGSTQANLTVELVGRSQQTTSNGAGAFSFANVALNLGANDLTVRVRDTFGNTAERIVTIQRDPTVPEPTVGLDPVSDTGTAGDNITSAASVTLAGTAPAGFRVELEIPARNTTVDSNGKYSFANVPLALGANNFNVTLIDNFGNRRVRSYSVTRVDALADPTLQLDRNFDAGTVGDLTTNMASVTLLGTTAPGALVELVGTGRSTTADAQGKYVFANFALNEGNNTLQVRTSRNAETVEKQFVVVRDNQDPTFQAPAAAVELFRGLAPADQTKVALDLWSIFLDADMNNSLVRLATNEGNVDIELYDKESPRTVANFLNYVESGAYNNTIFHRRDTNFVLQGGNNSFNGTSPNVTLPEIPESPSVLNEYSDSRPNVRGTLAMAKRGPDPGDPPDNQTINSATNNFFVNLKDNTNILNTSQNGGFTVFGKITDETMDVVDDLVAIPVQNRGGAFNQIPLQNFNGTFPGNLTPDNLAFISSATVLRQVEDLTFSNITTSNPNVTATVENNRIILTVPAAGAVTTQITITATDRAGSSVTGTFTVNIT